MTIKEAKERLDKKLGDSECYHIEFDDIIEEALMEIDPKLMKALKRLYDKSGEARWCA